MKVTVVVSLGLNGCRREATIEIADGTPEAEVEDIARDAMFEMIEWTHYPAEEKVKKG